MKRYNNLYWKVISIDNLILADIKARRGKTKTNGVITGSIKANFPTRIAFRVASNIDSRTILDSGGAENLIGKGDLLYSNGMDLERVQSAFVDLDELERIMDFIKKQK